jgi:subtilisin family serine protease
VPLRFPRPVISTAAIGLVVAWAALGAVPALAAPAGLAGSASGARPADQVRNQEWWLGALHITQAQQTTRGSGVTIALLDTGVDPGQPDLTGSVITGSDFTNSGESLGGQFFGIHGTAMASLIVGHGHGPGDADGVVGVAPGAKLLSVRVVLDSGDPLLSDSSVMSALPDAIAAGIRYAVANGAQVIDLPLDPGQSVSALTATPAPVAPPFTTPTFAQVAAAAAAGGSSAEQSAVAFALSQGVILVAPAGDNNATNDDTNFPADYPGVISVGAFDSSFIKASFSSHQSYVTLTAAGSGMIAAVPPAAGPQAGSPAGYATVSSTSAASAVVTGIVALIKSQYPELTPAEVTSALERSTVFRPPGGRLDGSGFGTADAARALAAAAGIAAPGPRRAGAGATSAQVPATTAAPVVSSGLKTKLYRDGLISVIVLVVLLLPTLAYGAMVRRRIQARRRPGTELAPVTRVPYAHNAATDSDVMSEYFAPIMGEPGGSGYAHRSSAAAGSAVAGLLPRSLVAPPRMMISRPPEVSGAPPWDPAPKPDSDLPWASRGVSSRPRRRVPAQPMPAPPPAGLPWAADPEAAAKSPAAAQEAGTAPAEARASLYVWNPASTGENSAEFAAGGSQPAGPGDAGGTGERASYRTGERTAYREDAPTYRDQPGYGDEAGYRDQPGNGDETGYRDQPGYRDEAGYRDQPGNWGQEPLAYQGQEPPAYQGHEPPGYPNQEPPAYQGHEPPAYQGQEPPSYQGHEPPGYPNQEPPSYQGQEPGGYGSEEPPAHQADHAAGYRADDWAGSGDDQGGPGAGF